jgi:hypothetical protein
MQIQSNNGQSALAPPRTKKWSSWLRNITFDKQSASPAYTTYGHTYLRYIRQQLHTLIAQ